MAPGSSRNPEGARRAGCPAEEAARRSLQVPCRNRRPAGTARAYSAAIESPCTLARSSTTFVKCRFVDTHTHVDRLPVVTVPAPQSSKVAAEMALSVLAYNLTRVMNIVGTKPLIAAIAA